MTNVVRAFKLISGQEIVGLFNDKQMVDSFIVLNKVREIAPTQDGKGGWQLQLAPYILMHADAEVNLYMHSIAIEITEIPSAFETEYVQAVSGFKLAKTLHEHM